MKRLQYTIGPKVGLLGCGFTKIKLRRNEWIAFAKIPPTRI